MLHENSNIPTEYDALSFGYFYSTLLIDGVSDMPKCEGPFNVTNVETGHSGNGCIRITVIEQYINNNKCTSHFNKNSFVLFSISVFVNSE